MLKNGVMNRKFQDQTLHIGQGEQQVKKNKKKVKFPLRSHVCNYIVPLLRYQSQHP